MARQKEHSAPSELQIIPETIEEICKSILRGKLRDEDDIQQTANQVENMLVRKFDFECVQAKIEILEADSETHTAEIKTLQAEIETTRKERLGIKTRDFVRGIVRQTSGVDQQELVLKHGTYKRHSTHSLRFY